VTYAKWATFASLVGAICVVGCKGDAAPPVAATNTNTPVVSKGGAQSGGANAGLNPNYKGSAATDDSRVGSAMKGK
jgi:hypothetical protein